MQYIRYTDCPVIKENNVKIINEDRERCLLAMFNIVL